MTMPARPSSERGMALIVVLLLMGVLSGLATGFALTGQTEAQMGKNEVYFAGARAAAEAGLNRALAEVLASANNGINFFAGPDGLISTTPGHADNADNGILTGVLGAATNGKYSLGTTGQYSYAVQVYDDDNDILYGTPLTVAQRTQMGEPAGEVDVDQNQRIVLRAIGYGPDGTTVRLARLIDNVPNTQTTTTTTPGLSNPALLVNGDLSILGITAVNGTSGKVHVNGNLGIGGIASFSGDVTATGTLKKVGLVTYGGAHTGGAQAVNTPNIQAADYQYLADYKLAVVGGVGQIQSRDANGNWEECTSTACTSTGFTYSGGTWSLIGVNNLSSGTYYAEGAVSILGVHQGASGGNLPFSLIATGSISLGGVQNFTPENSEKIQFVTNGDFKLLGVQDLNDATTVEGQIMVREQIELIGVINFQGRVVVQNASSASNLVTSNTFTGATTFTYNGTLGAVDSVTTTTTSTTYVTNISGWLEQQ